MRWIAENPKLPCAGLYCVQRAKIPNCPATYTNGQQHSKTKSDISFNIKAKMYSHTHTRHTPMRGQLIERVRVHVSRGALHTGLGRLSTRRDRRRQCIAQRFHLGLCAQTSRKCPNTEKAKNQVVIEKTCCFTTAEKRTVPCLCCDTIDIVFSLNMYYDCWLLLLIELFPSARHGVVPKWRRRRVRGGSAAISARNRST